MAHPVDAVRLALVVVESMFYGMFLVLFIRCFGVLVERAQSRHQRHVNPMMATAVILFCTITTHWALNLSLTFDALTVQDLSYSGTKKPVAIALSVVYFTTICVGDAFMIYRLWVVWGHDYLIIIVPIVLECCLIATSAVITWLVSKENESVLESGRGLIISCGVLTLVSNVFSTILIAMRIHISNLRSETKNDASTRVFRTLIESATLYSICLTLSLGTFIARSSAQFIIIAVNSPVVGIIFTMIVVRSNPLPLLNPSRAGAVTSVEVTHSFATQGHQNGLHPLSPVTVMISNENNMTIPLSPMSPTSPKFKRESSTTEPTSDRDSFSLRGSEISRARTASYFAV